MPAEAGSAQPAVNAMLAIDAVAARTRSRAICPAPSKPSLSVPNGMLAQAGDNGNRAQRHLKLPQAALARVTTHPGNPMQICACRAAASKSNPGWQ